MYITLVVRQEKKRHSTLGLLVIKRRSHNITRQWHEMSHFTESVQNHYQAELKKNEAGLTYHLFWFHSIIA